MTEVVVVTKRCARCKEEKALSEFHRNSSRKDGHSVYCKVCRSAEYGSPESVERMYNVSILRNYGLTREQYDAMVEAQDGRCAICGVDPSTEMHRNIRYRRLHVDHWHNEHNNVRGLLCGNCNLGIGRWLDDPELLYRAIEYLEAHEHSRYAEADLSVSAG